MSWCCCFKQCCGASHDFDLPGEPVHGTAKFKQTPAYGGELNEKQSFFVVTAIFNPAKFKSRYDLYHKFARHMQECGAQLITIECIFPTLNQTQFQVTSSTNPNHIQLKSDSVYWVKESLINIAVNRLPRHAKYVCWLDADLQFHDPGWIQKTISQLKEYSIVQMFEKANFLGPVGEVLRTDYSFGYSVVHGKPIDQTRYDEWYPHSGYGWATTVNAFRQLGGLPDYDILGSGDLHFAFSLLDRVTNALESDLNPEFKNLILQRSKYTFQKLNELSNYESKLRIGYVPMTISHNWHGSRKHRQYVNRWKILIAHNFNYVRDTRKNVNGLLQLTCTNDKKPTLQDDIIAYFAMRNEDDVEFQPEDNIVSSKPSRKESVKKLKKKIKKLRGGRIKLKHPVGDLGFDDDGDSASYSSNSGPDCGDGDEPDCGIPGSGSDSDGNDDPPGPGDGEDKEDGVAVAVEAGGYSNDYGGGIETTSQY